ncbi:hypothetical protein B0T25DRAFT_549524 [Lasiosphaeria hispida]|uniref:Secreted protein n=1 Tax=Lasiosphaeria hispida TaxID=260671 RepID=A0AAJ0HFR3_9PEZI|nr:hypothetical protein B0T25DRAFT_549524 [Lasiosphaeria hispida]
MLYVFLFHSSILPFLKGCLSVFGPHVSGVSRRVNSWRITSDGWAQLTYGHGTLCRGTARRGRKPLLGHSGNS